MPFSQVNRSSLIRRKRHTPEVLFMHFRPTFSSLHIGWNATIEQALRGSQVIRASYVGAHARRLLRAEELNINSVNPNFGTVLFL